MEALVKIADLTFKDEQLVVQCVHEMLKLHFVKELQKIPGISSLKLGIAITRVLCTAIEHSKIKNKDEKIDKKKLALEVLGLVFPGLTVTDLNLYGQQIEFLLNNEIIRAKAKTTIIKIYHKVCKLKCLSKKKK